MATPGMSTHSLEITDPRYDAKGWWDRNLVMLAIARFDDGEVRVLRYHPGRYGCIRHCVLAYGDLLLRVGLVVLDGDPKACGANRRAKCTPSRSRGKVLVFSGLEQMKEHLFDKESYKEEGYYIGDDLFIRGRIFSRHFV